MRRAIYPSDIVELTGRCEKSAQQMIRKIKQANNIPKQGFVSITMFCQYTGFDEQEVERAINKKSR